MAAQMIAAMPRTSAVVDEPAHLTAGYLAAARGDLTVNREHPPLVKTLAALPLLAVGPVLPPETPGGPPRWSEDFEFAYSREFLYKANDADRILYLARLPIVAITLLAGALLFAWGRALVGPAGALAALALFVFEPNLLAHGRLVTTDMGASLFTLAALACVERSRAPRDPSRGAPLAWEILGGIALGLALLTRFSSILLIPILALALLADRRPAPRPGRWRGPLRVLAVALLTVNAGYGLPPRGILFPLASAPVTEPLRSEPLASMESGSLARWTPVPLPRLYLEGLDLARFKNREVEGPGYLNGAYSRDGWWTYFLQALAMKTTIPFLLLAVPGIALIAAGAKRPESRAMIAYVLVPAAAVLLATTALTRAQIGLRYVLPVVPLICLAGGAAAGRLLTARSAIRRGPAAVLAILFLWHAGSALWIHPYHLAYFNEAAGGPSRGHLHLVDSNLDWGQDLIGLRVFMKERGLSRINLYYFGTADPEYYGIRRAVPPEPGWFAVSATHLMGVYLPDRDYLAPLRSLRPEASIGHSILLYRLEPVPPFLQVPIRRR